MLRIAALLGQGRQTHISGRRHIPIIIGGHGLIKLRILQWRSNAQLLLLPISSGGNGILIELWLLLLLHSILKHLLYEILILLSAASYYVWLLDRRLLLLLLHKLLSHAVIHHLRCLLSLRGLRIIPIQLVLLLGISFSDESIIRQWLNHCVLLLLSKVLLLGCAKIRGLVSSWVPKGALALSTPSHLNWSLLTHLLLWIIRKVSKNVEEMKNSYLPNFVC